MAAPTARTRSAPAPLQPSQIATLVLGLLFLAVGIVGFIITGFDNFADHTGDTLLGFEINGMHNTVHLVLGLLGVVLWRRVDTSLAFGLISGIGYAAALIYGLFALNESWDVLSLNTADNWLHLGLGLAGFGVAALALRDRMALEAPEGRRAGSGMQDTLDIDELERQARAERQRNVDVLQRDPVEERHRGPGASR